MSDWDERPWAELVEEARRRGVPAAESMGREALIETLRGREPSRSGPLSIARSLLGRVASTVARAVLTPPERHRASAPPAFPAAMAQNRAPDDDGARAAGDRELERSPPPAGAERLTEPAFAGIAFASGPDALTVVWRAGRGALERAQLVAPARAGLRLRVVRVSWPAGADAPRRVGEDHAAQREGWLSLAPLAPGEKIVIAIGLASDGGEFVAIEHATLG